MPSRSNDHDVLGSYWTLAGPVDVDADFRPSPWDVEERVATAAEAGFTGMGFWHDDLERILEEWRLPELGDLLDAHGIEHVELEFLNDWFVEPGEPKRVASDERRAWFYEAADALGARHVKVGNLTKTPCSVSTMAEAFEALCADAADHDVLIALEFTTGDPNLDTLDGALEVVEGVIGGNGGLLLDVWHLGKLGVTPEEIRALPDGSVVGMELNDGYRETDMGRSEETLNHRLLPGEGEFDVRGMVEAVRALGFDGPWGVEVLNRELRQLPMDELYRRAYETTAAVLE